MVNPGAFQGSRKSYLEAALPGYFKAVEQGCGPEFLQTTIRGYLKRYPIDLDEKTEPTEEQLARVDDNEASPDVHAPSRDPGESEKDFEARVEVFEQQKKDTRAKIDQITRWFKYRHGKRDESSMKGEPHPLDILLGQLAGITISKPGRMRTAYNVWGKENQELIDELIAERQESKAGDGPELDFSGSGEQDGEASKNKRGRKGKQKKVRKFVKNGEEAFLAVRQEIMMSEFAKLPEDVQSDWKARAEEEHKERLEKWKACQGAQFSTAPEDRQKCIDRLVKFMQPILDGVYKATGWPCTLIAGGPEPADAGRLNILSIHSGTTSGPVPLTFGAACRPAFKKYWILVFTAFLQMCFTMEESKSRSLVNTTMPCLRSQLEDQGGEATASVDQVDAPGWEGFMEELKNMIDTGVGEEPTVKAKSSEDPSGKAESGRSEKIAKLRQNASQRTRKSGIPDAASSAPTTGTSASRHTTVGIASRPQPQKITTSPPENPRISPSFSSTAARMVTSFDQSVPPATAPPDTPQPLTETSSACHESTLPPLTRPSSASRESSPVVDRHSSLPSPSLPRFQPHRMSSPSNFRELSPVPAMVAPVRMCSPSPTSHASVDATVSRPAAKLSTRSRGETANGDSESTGSSKRKDANAGHGLSTSTRGFKKRKLSSGKKSVANEGDKHEHDEIDEGSEVLRDTEDKAIVVPDNAPVYIWKVVEMCERLKLGDEMNALVAAWVEMEGAAGYESNGLLTAVSQPVQIAEWIQHGQQPGFNAKIPDVEQYGDRFIQWFKHCSPSWRTKSNGSILMSRQSGMDWKDMKITGQNGIASIVAGMAFWKTALDALPRNTARHRQVLARLEKDFHDALQELLYSITEMTKD
ncbi:SERTA domain-containing protein 3 [Marasmius crinis-equi]|uniref:SERTA domain-containing protein 3 n=1 Tax=Marasmius crinis-equi TaxID=585013 RepID=A0ABR3FLM7_9AGAR